MKKSNALMLSYIIFLVIAFLVDCFFAWDGLGKVAMAATLAGLFFAIADLIGWHVASEQDFCKAVQKALKAVIASVDKLKLFSESVIEENKEIVEMISSYDEKDDALDEALRASEAMIVSQKETVEASEKNKNKAEELNEKIIDIKSRKIKRLKKAETSIIVLGFASFFVISSFDYLYALLLRAESSVTVIAFGVIMVTYFLKEIFVNKHTSELENVLGSLTESEVLLSRMMQDVTERKRTKEIKRLIRTKETQKALTDAIAMLALEGKSYKNGETASDKSPNVLTLEDNGEGL